MRGEASVSVAPAVDIVRLTEWAKCAGCAAKMGPLDLKAALAPLKRLDDPRLLVGHETFDDAGIFQITPDLALVQTLDFFAPIVDDPYDFGRVAATNALSDVFAMGGEALTAMNIVGFPVGKLPIEVMSEILRGGQTAVHAAGASIVGGHSIVDEELKYGLSVTGTVHPGRVLTNAGAKVGDVLVLTKGIGTGVLATAAKRNLLGEAEHKALIASMTTLNLAASRAAQRIGAKCATDITGFALLGHSSHIARASKVSIRINAGDIPWLPGAQAMVEQGALTGGSARNSAYLEPLVDWGRTTEVIRALLVDPQTSGGLLVAMPREKVADFSAGLELAQVVGEVIPQGPHAIVIA
jgi:selenide,water dikinase